ncbi:MAG: hypothetical protein AAB456_00545 [Patescibacteria group bacterium]
MDEILGKSPAEIKYKHLLLVRAVKILRNLKWEFWEIGKLFDLTQERIKSIWEYNKSKLP